MPARRGRATSNVDEAANDDQQVSSSRRINRKMDLLDQKIDSLYKDIYVTRPDDRQNMDSILNKLDSAIDDMQADDVNVSGISELLRRLDRSGNGSMDELNKDVVDLFNDQGLMTSLFANDELRRYIAAMDAQVDTILKYMPKLLDALEIKRDNVLSSDNFDKQFINPQPNKTSKAEVEKFSANQKKLENKYDMSQFFDDTYMNVSKYGEDFIYIVPYDIAFERVIKSTNIRRNTARLGYFNMYENANPGSRGSKDTEVVVQEGYYKSDEFKKLSRDQGVELYEGFDGCNVTLKFNDSGVITQPINERVVIENKMQLESLQSLASVHEANIGGLDITSNSKLQKEFEKINNAGDGLSNAPADGLFIPGSVQRDPNKIDKDFLGAVVERLPRESIIPVYIGNTCMGYYYLEYGEDKDACGFCGGHHYIPTYGNTSKFREEMSEDQQELAIRYVCAKISDSIDNHFINANKDLKEEIYAVLRYNEKFDISKSSTLGVTFIPAEDIVHCYFKLDEETHRGISDMDKALIPAMLYILLYLTDLINKVSRSSDHRIYYVRQNVETNVARTMMNVVEQIKKGNMGMRQIQSMNSILNIVGKYNDYIIPMGPSGDPPITFEVMQGQESQTPSELMDKMLEEAVNGTGVPFEMLNSIYQQDFAIRFSMSNTRFLKAVNTRQREVEKFFSRIYTKIYNYEFNEKNSLIKITLPPPIYLNLNNTSQLIDNVSQQADKLIETELYDETDEVKSEFKKLYIREYLATYFDYSNIEKIKGQAKVAVEAKKQPETEESGEDEEY